jgi:phage terminase large subunit
MMRSLNIADPVRFAHSVFNVSLWAKQRDILNAIADNRRVAVRACHASGKTFAAAVAALWFACRHRDARVITLAPGWLTTRAVIWSEIHSLLQRARYKLPTTAVNQTEIRFGPNNLLIGLSTNEPTRLQGHHAEHILLIADEAVGIDPSFWPAIEGILASGDSHLLLLGNPTVNSGYFYDAFTRNRAAWSTHTISAFDTPNLAGLTLDELLTLPDAALDDNSHPFLTTRHWVRERYNEWFNGSPENSPLWQSRVLGEFPSASSNALIPLSLLEAARRAPVDPGERVIIGIDPAGLGRDRTVATACSGGAVLDTGVWTDADARGPVMAFIRKYEDRLQIIRVDSGGIGFYFAEHLRSNDYRTEGLNAASKAKDAERYANLKAERYWFLRERFQRGEISGLSDEALAELAAITYTVDTAGRIAIEGKADVKSTLGRSPDLAESLMIAIGEQPPQPFAWMPVPAKRASSLWDVQPADSNRLYGKAEDVFRDEDRKTLNAVQRWGPRWGGSGF